MVSIKPGTQQFADVAPRVVASWRARATVESPSHLRDHPEPLMQTLLAALLHTRLREITDTLVELLISTVHRIGARADKKVTEGGAGAGPAVAFLAGSDHHGRRAAPA
jgi:hypothetical protein